MTQATRREADANGLHFGDGEVLSLLYNLYETRIRNYIENPPPEDWNGAFALLTK